MPLYFDRERALSNARCIENQISGRRYPDRPKKPRSCGGMQGMMMTRYRKMAESKGLKLRRIDNGQWNITLPNGEVYVATDDFDMRRYVGGY